MFAFCSPNEPKRDFLRGSQYFGCFLLGSVQLLMDPALDGLHPRLPTETIRSDRVCSPGGAADWGLHSETHYSPRLKAWPDIGHSTFRAGPLGGRNRSGS